MTPCQFFRITIEGLNVSGGGFCIGGKYDGERIGFGVCLKCSLRPEGWIPEGSKTTLDNILPIPRDQWPKIAKIISKFRHKDDIGLGSTIERRIIGKKKSELFKKYYKKLVGSDCGCTDRTIILNIKYPYTKEKARD